MLKVEHLIDELRKLPEGSKVNGYEGEDTGLHIQLPNGQWGWIHACEDEACEQCSESKLKVK
jgi:hypothetical protein